MAESAPSLDDLNERSREIFGRLVETYLTTGDPVGSRTLARSMEVSLSPATIRNVMQDLEELGLLGSPHISAGRVPTQQGLRLFVDGVLEIGAISQDERRQIERSVAGHEDDYTSTIPLRRLGTPDEVADVIHFLCEKGSSYVSGAEIQINGGQHV